MQQRLLGFILKNLACIIGAQGEVLVLGMNGKFAEIALEPVTRVIKRVTVYEKLRFRCIRCAVFCCLLGGPKLSVTDIECLKNAGHDEADFLDTVRNGLKIMANGSCCFLRLNGEKNLYECSVYDSRPLLCRLYPFHFQWTGLDTFVVRIMPCRGLSRRFGNLLDERFLCDYLQDALRGLLAVNFIIDV